VSYIACKLSNCCNVIGYSVFLYARFYPQVSHEKWLVVVLVDSA